MPEFQLLVHLVQNLDFWEYVGVLGSGIYAVRYLLVAFDRLPSQYPAHYWSSLVAALLVMVSLYQSFNLAAAQRKFSL
ncbi:MAG: CBU_0592 family membrane protein [Boseongicola sp.]